MGGILRITRAEFIKIFKKPSVYIMGILLAFVLVLSAFLFSPASTATVSVSISGSTVSAMYENWLTGITTDSKTKMDISLTDAESEINFYTNLSERNQSLQTALSEFYDSESTLHADVASGASESEQNYHFTFVKTKLMNLINTFTTTYGLDSYAFYSTYLDSDVYLNLYNTDSTDLGVLNLLLQHANADSASHFDTYFQTNNLTTTLSVMQSFFGSEVLQLHLDELSALFDDYENSILQSLTFTFDVSMELYRVQMKQQLSNFQNYFLMLQTSNDSNSAPYDIVLIDDDLYESTMSFISNMIDTLNETEGNSESNLYLVHKQIVKDLKQSGFESMLQSAIDGIMPVTVSDDALSVADTLVHETVVNISNDLITEMEDFVSENGSSILTPVKDEFLVLLANYKALTETTEQYVSNLMQSDLLSEYSPNTIATFKNYQLYNDYQVKEENVRLDYYFQTGTFSNDYNNVFSFNANSSSETSVYDFMYFALKISTVIIVLFAIIMASNILAYEFDTGTIKLLAIRPFKRYKILLGKLLAVAFFSIIFVLFSALIAFIAGLSRFALINTSILAVFNAQVAFTIHPALLMLIVIACTILEVLFYAVIAISLSTVFRSFAVAMATSTITFLVAMIANIFLGGFLWYTYIPFTNTNFFRFMGGVFNKTTENTSIFSTLFNGTLLSNTNIIVSAVIYVVFSALMLWVGYAVLKKREI